MSEVMNDEMAGQAETSRRSHPNEQIDVIYKQVDEVDQRLEHLFVLTKAVRTPSMPSEPSSGDVSQKEEERSPVMEALFSLESRMTNIMSKVDKLINSIDL